jgi:hypothetical protein
MAREAYAHDAVVALDPCGDPYAPGGAVTVALCGHWGHEAPCPLAPHHTSAATDGDTVELRVLFATEPANEERVRSLIAEGLACGRLAGPDGRTTTWSVRSAHASRVRPDEEDHAARLLANP